LDDILRRNVIERADLVVLAPAPPVAELLGGFRDRLPTDNDAHGRFSLVVRFRVRFNIRRRGPAIPLLFWACAIRERRAWVDGIPGRGGRSAQGGGSAPQALSCKVDRSQAWLCGTARSPLAGESLYRFDV